MTHDIATPSQTPSVQGSGYLLPLIGAIVLTLIWGGYTIWVSLEILSQAPRS